MGNIKLPPIITHAYIMVTEQCNLRCQYCYIKNRDIKNEFPFEWMEKVKKMFTCYNKPRIIFFGGEPLLKVELIKQIVNEYKNKDINIYHFDVYRLEDVDEFYAIGGEEYFSSGISIIEWGELIEPALPNDYIKITFEKDLSDENIRYLHIKTFGNKYNDLF